MSKTNKITGLNETDLTTIQETLDHLNSWSGVAEFSNVTINLSNGSQASFRKNKGKGKWNFDLTQHVYSSDWRDR